MSAPPRFPVEPTPAGRPLNPRRKMRIAQPESAGSAARSRSISIFSAFRLTSIGSLLTIVFGVATNKIIAFSPHGTEYIGLISLYRNLSSSLSAFLSMQVANVVVQRISMARTPEQEKAVLRGTWALFLLQILAALLLTLFAAPTIARLMFGERAPEHIVEIRLVTAFVLGVLGLQIVSALLNGRSLIKQVTSLNVITSLLTLATVYPLLLLGRPGLAMVIGLTCVLGAAMGARHVWREYGLTWDDLRFTRRTWPRRSDLPASLSLLGRTIVYNGTLLVVQSIINRHYGSQLLGLYGAATMIESNFIMVMMSSMTTFYLPALGKMDDDAQKGAFLNKILGMLLVLLLPSVVLLILGAPILVSLLFSPDFAPAVPLIRVLCLSIVTQPFIWCYAVFLTHKAQFRTYLMLDAARMSLLLVGVLFCARQNRDLVDVVWIYSGSYYVLAVLYIGVLMTRHGRAFLSARNAGMGLFVVVWTALAYALSTQGRGPQAFFVSATVLLTVFLVKGLGADLALFKKAKV